MGLDSVEIVMAWEESFSIHITDAEARCLRTPRMATDLICHKFGAANHSGACLSQRAFYRARNACMQVLSCTRASMTPHTRLIDLVPFRGRRRAWLALSEAAGIPFPNIMFGLWSESFTFGKLVQRLVARQTHTLHRPTFVWTRSQVREVVRAVVSDQVSIPKFSDDADFVTDLRID